MNKVLVIEDNKEIRENTAELLEINGYTVYVAENGRLGYESAKRDYPDIILCDILMPKTDGREFLQLAKVDNSISNIPIIFFSAGSSLELQKTLLYGNNAFLKKPFTEKELLLIIQDGLNPSLI